MLGPLTVHSHIQRAMPKFGAHHQARPVVIAYPPGLLGASPAVGP
ncbi:hypothetical protein [Streptomyces umbrinus]|nr:hypothetical protein [Streptomyces umbrinus]